MRKIIFLMTGLALMLASCSSLKHPKMNKTYTTDSGMKMTFYEMGSGPEADSNDVVKMHYTGKLENDSIFGSSYQRNKPFRFRLGKEEVIEGWEVAVDYMHEGDSAIMVIPPEMAYGDQKSGDIPANSTLTFNVKVVDVKKAPKPFDIFNAEKQELENGLEIYTVKEGEGRKIKDDDFVKVHYTGYLENDKMFDSSVEDEKPIQIQLGKNQVIKGWEQALLQLNVGDKARIVIPPELAYGEKGRGEIPANETLTFDVKIIKAKSPVNVEPYDVSGKDTTFTKTGLGIIKVKTSQGPDAKKGDKIKVHYTGYLSDGEIFDSSVEADQPITFKLGEKKVIPGWEEGLLHMKEGEKARLIIPYQLGYGEKGYGPIPPKSQLIFDMELLEIK